MKILFINALLLTMEDEDIFSGELLVSDSKIAYIGKKAPRENIDQIIDCKGNLLMPGFKNAHAHTAMVFARSAADDLPLHDWLFDVIFPMEKRFEKDDIYHLTKCGILEYLSSGITAAFDMYFHHDEVRKASLDMGFRTVLLATSDQESVELIENRYKTWNEKDSLVSYQIGIHAEYTTSFARIKEIASLCQKLHARAYLHVDETEEESEGCVIRYGKRPLELLESVGFFDYGGGGFHCNYFSDKEIEIAKKRHVYVISCPASNLKLASGIAPLYKYEKAGLTIALGTDGAASNNSLNMFKEMYLASSLQKVINKDPSVMDGFDVLKMATVNSAHAMGLNNADILKEGKFADIIMIDLKSPSMQPINNIAKNIVYAGDKDIVKMTMINGKILYFNHQFFLDYKIDDIYAKTQEITKRLKNG